MPICYHCGEEIIAALLCSECNQYYCSLHIDAIIHECNLVKETKNQPLTPSESFQNFSAQTSIDGDSNQCWFCGLSSQKTFNCNKCNHSYCEIHIELENHGCPSLFDFSESHKILIMNEISKEAGELYNKAIEFINKLDFQNALEFLNKSLELDPNYAEAMSQLGYVHYKLNYKNMSREDVFNLSKKALDLKSKSPITWHYMGGAYKNKKEYDKAIECSEKAIELDPKYAQPWNNMGIVYEDKKEYDKAIECYKKAIKIDPKSATVWNNLGILYDQKYDYDKAIRCYKKELEINPRAAATWNNLGVLYKKKDNNSKALECFRKAIDIDPNIASTWNNLGILYGKTNFDRALECYRKATYIDPKDSFPWNNMGILYEDKKEYDKAIACYKKVIELDPKDETVRNNLRLAQEKKKQSN